MEQIKNIEKLKPKEKYSVSICMVVIEMKQLLPLYSHLYIV